MRPTRALKLACLFIGTTVAVTLALSTLIYVQHPGYWTMTPLGGTP